MELHFPAVSPGPRATAFNAYPVWPPNATEARVWREEGGPPVSSYKFFDAAGRVLQAKSEDTADAAGDHQLVQDTEFDALGRTAREYLPYRIAGGSVAFSPSTVDRLFKSYDYDVKNRVTAVHFLDGTAITTAYLGLYKSVTDIVGHTTATLQDGAGNLVWVKNINPAGADVVTRYYYDGLGNLTDTLGADGAK